MPTYQPPKDFAEVLAPGRHAEECRRCSLFWFPVSGVPLPQAEKAWYYDFLTRLQAALEPKLKTRMDLFLLQQTVVERCLDPFLDESLETRPFPGLARRPGQALRGPATKQDVEDLQQNRRPFDPFDYTDAFYYWLCGGKRPDQLKKYFGLGGMTVAYLKGPPAPPPPPPRFPDFILKDPRMQDALKNSSVEQELALSHSLAAPFLKESKQKLLADLPQTLYVRSLGFVMPRLKSADFFSQPEEYIKTVFSLFHCLIIESPEDHGVLVASENDLRQELYEIRKAMREAKPEEARR